MKKLANYLVNRRHIIFALFLVLAAVSAIFMGKVHVNHDMTKYLPDDSSMKIGMDIMEEEFGTEESSSLQVMFSGLSDAEKSEIYDDLSSLDNVESVDYEADSADYRSARETMDIREALTHAYSGSMHTIMTSSLIVVAVTGILGLTLSDPTVGSICLTLAEGALCATLLILFLLPGALACTDRLICRKQTRKKRDTHE